MNEHTTTEPDDLLTLLANHVPALSEDDAETQHGLTLPERFVRFYRANPHLYTVLEQRVANWYRSTGGRKTGVEMFLSSIRYDLGVTTRSDPYKVNNSYAPFLTRLLIHRHPEWSDLFETRKSIADADTSWLTEVAA